MNKSNFSSVASDLDKILRYYDWYQATGKKEDCLVIYCKSEPPKKIKSTFRGEYQGVTLVWKVVGEIAPLGS